MAASRRQKSTTVRIFQALRLAFRLGEKLAPGLASRLAGHLWFRVASHRHSPTPAPAQTIELDSDGTTVRGYDWGNGPLVYLQHGWGGCVGDLDVLASRLVADGYRVIAVDGPSHGNSEPGPFGPRASSPSQLSGALGAAIDKFGEPHAVVAHSLGCLASVIALRERIEPNRLVLISPFIGGGVFVRMFADQVGIGPRTFARFLAAAERRVGRTMDHFDIPKPPMAVETLIVHDRHDRSTPFEHARIIANAWPNARLSATEGLGHRRILHNPTVVAEVTAFVGR